MVTLSFSHTAYPHPLRVLTKPPQHLYVEGSIEALAHTIQRIAVVGSRKPSTYGQMVTERLVPGLVRAGLSVVSGLAYGIDAIAHQTVVRLGGSGIAVLGSGHDCLYPAANQVLAHQLMERGCVVSAYPPQQEPRPYQFIERNQIIAALSPVVVVMEAGARSGALITARYALEYGHSVAVVLGDITRPENEGCYYLAKQGAAIVRDVQDITALYQLETAVPAPLPLQPALTGSAAAVYDCISCGHRAPEEIAARTGLRLAELHDVFSVLELDGYIKQIGSEWLITSSL